MKVSGVCGDPSPDQYVYNDPFDPMGRLSPVRQMSMEHKLELGLLPSSAVKIVAGPGAYRIAPMETLSGSPELLRIPKPGGGNYYVEYRQPIGFFDSQAPQMNGVVRTLMRTCDELRAMGHEIAVISPDLFNAFPCPTYPEIRLAFLPGRAVARRIMDSDLLPG